MGILEAFLGAAIVGMGALLVVVATWSWRRARDRKTAVLAAGFGALAVAGGALLAGELLGPPFQDQAPTVMAAAVLACLLLLYAALFARRS